MTQNIYDDPVFFTNYSQLPRSLQGLDGAPEWPALRAMLPPLAGLAVLDLGCGFGWFCRWAAGQGARSVLGVDVSQRMLERARRDTADRTVGYRQADLERFVPEEGAFDLVYSSLAFHYIADLDRLLTCAGAALVPGGRLVCSVEHPMMTAPMLPGWSRDESGRPCWPVSAYLDEGPRSVDWLAAGVIKQHRTIAGYLGLLSGAGFALTGLIEWGPSPEQVAANPDWVPESQRPPFLLLQAMKAGPAGAWGFKALGERAGAL